MNALGLQDLFIKILCAELTETELDASIVRKLTPDVVKSLYTLSKRHDLAHIVSSCLNKHGALTDGEIQAKFKREELLAIYRYEQIKFAFQQICGIFDQEEIPYIPLKGSVIRSHYPKESMRTSCDIDILVKEEDIDKAADALVKNNYKYEAKEYHDVSLFSPNNVHLELHFNIQENMDNLDIVLKEAWQFAEEENGSRYKFTSEFFMFHMFAHMSYHFLGGGCGIRPLMDIWVMKHRMKIDYRDAKILFERAGIYRFAEEISNLAEICFSGKEKNADTDILLSYIFDGGVYGTETNRLAVKKEENKSHFSYILHRLFMPYRDMTVTFPVLKRLPILLPFCWIVRIFKMLFCGRVKSSISEVKNFNDLSDGKVETVKEIKNILGL